MSGRYDFDLAVIGMGSAGMTAARAGRAFGLRTVGVEHGRLGGDCLWTGCVPSKALLSAARAAHTMRSAATWGLDPVEPQVDLERVLERVRGVQQVIAHGEDAPERFTELGIALRTGPARLVGPHTVLVGREPLTAGAIVVCTGGRPVVPPVDGLEEAGCLTSETLWDVERLPRSVVALGGGPLSVELAQALARLGVQVTVLEQGDRLLALDEPALTAVLAERLRSEGVDLRLRATATRVEATPLGRRVHAMADGAPVVLEAEHVLVCTGRRPNVEGLGLEDLGVQVRPDGIVVGPDQRTSVPSVWAAGDVTGSPYFTHWAGFAGARAVRNAAFPGRDRRQVVVPWCTYTDPELAHVGLTEARARERHRDVEAFELPLAANDRAQTEGATDGAVKLVTARGRLVGAHVLAPAAGEVINGLTAAIEQRRRLAELATVVHVYPTVAIAVQQLAARAAYGRARRLRWLARTG